MALLCSSGSSLLSIYLVQTQHQDAGTVYRLVERDGGKVAQLYLPTPQRHLYRDRGLLWCDLCLFMLYVSLVCHLLYIYCIYLFNVFMLDECRLNKEWQTKNTVTFLLRFLFAFMGPLLYWVETLCCVHVWNSHTLSQAPERRSRFRSQDHVAVYNN